MRQRRVSAVEHHTVRFQLEFTNGTDDRIKDLMLITGLRSKTEIFNNALTLFNWAIEERRAGRQIASFDRWHGIRSELHLPALDSILASDASLDNIAGKAGQEGSPDQS